MTWFNMEKISINVKAVRRIFDQFPDLSEVIPPSA